MSRTEGLTPGAPVTRSSLRQAGQGLLQNRPCSASTPRGPAPTRWLQFASPLSRVGYPFHAAQHLLMKAGTRKRLRFNFGFHLAAPRVGLDEVAVTLTMT